MGSVSATSILRKRLESVFDGLTQSRLATLVLSAICGLGLTASAVTLVRAADDAGVLSFIRSEALDRVARSVRLPSQRPVQQANVSPTRSDRRHASAPARPRKVARASRTGFASLNQQILSRRTMCVRICDGYMFPVGVLQSRHDLPAHENACAAACPGAATSLYTLAPGQHYDEPADARSIADGSVYKRLRTAFLYTHERVSACSCQGPDNIARATPILLDPTLRRGDVVIDREGAAQVYAGSGQVPHSPRAFAEYRRSRALGRTARAQVDRLVGTSQRAALARDYQRRTRIREASLGEVRAPAGSAAGVRVYQVRSDGGTLDPSGARIIAVR